MTGAVPLVDVLAHEPDLLVPVPEPTDVPVDLATYRVRLARWETGAGPNLHGIREFVAVLEGLDEPASPVVLPGETTSYIVLLSADRTRLLASTAIDGQSEPIE